MQSSVLVTDLLIKTVNIPAWQPAECRLSHGCNSNEWWFLDSSSSRSGPNAEVRPNKHWKWLLGLTRTAAWGSSGIVKSGDCSSELRMLSLMDLRQFHINITASVGPDLAILVKCKMRVSRERYWEVRGSQSIKKSPVLCGVVRLDCDPPLVDNILMLLEQSYNNTTDTVTFLVNVSSSNDDKGKVTNIQFWNYRKHLGWGEETGEDQSLLLTLIPLIHPTLGSRKTRTSSQHSQDPTSPW